MSEDDAWKPVSIGTKGELSVRVASKTRRLWGDPTVLRLTDGMWYVLRGVDDRGDVVVCWERKLDGGATSREALDFVVISGPYPTLDAVQTAYLLIVGEE